ADVIGYRKDFTILDREDARDLLKACIAEEKLDSEEMRFPKPEVVGDILSLAVNMRQPVRQIITQHYDYFDVVGEQIAGLATKFQARKQAANVMDFDDLLVLWLKLLEEDEPTREVYQ